MKQTVFYRVITLITFFLSCYSWWLLYNQQSLWWILLGLMLLVTMLTFIYGLKSVRRILAVPGLSLPISDFLLTASAIGYFASALVGFMIVIFNLPFHDKSFMIFPLIIAVLIFGGVTLDLFGSFNKVTQNQNSQMGGGGYSPQYTGYYDEEREEKEDNQDDSSPSNREESLHTLDIDYI